MSWAPLFEEEGKEIKALLKRIAAGVEAFPDDDPSLENGAAGKALMYSYLARAGLCDATDSEKQLEKAIGAHDRLPEESYLAGAGVAWTAAHLQRGAANDAFDEVLLERLSTAEAKGDYELYFGWVGVGVYALERLPRPSAWRLLEAILDLLDSTKIPQQHGWAWRSPPHRIPGNQTLKEGTRYYNLGLAHGVPGVIAWLSAAYQAGLVPERTRRLLLGAVEWLLSLRSTSPRGFSFPFGVAIPGKKAPASFVGWCYGDLGVGIALLRAAWALREASYEKSALDIILRVTRRTPPTFGVVDGSLCHGTAGLLHIFNRLYQATGHPEIRASAQKWYQYTTGLRQPGKGIAGWRTYRPPYVRDAGWLTGVSGIALALLATITDQEPRWDRALLLDLPLLPHSGAAVLTS